MPNTQVKDKLITLEELGAAYDNITPASIGALNKSGDTMTGRLNINNGSTSGGGVGIWEDGEGGNISIYSPNGKEFQIDAVGDESLRCHVAGEDGVRRSVGFNRNTGVLSASGGFEGNATNVTGTVAVEHGGTGATNAASARANLEITPANIGIRSGTLVKDFSNGSNHILFSEFALTGRPATVILTPSNRNIAMRYDWDNSSTYIDLYAHEVVDGSGVTGAVRFSYIIIP